MTSLLTDIETLSLRQQVAQMVVVRASGYLFDHQIQYPAWEPTTTVLQHWVETLGVGGVILLGGSAGELALRTQQLQEWATVPLLVAADVEEGVGQRFSGATWFPPPMALAAVAQGSIERAERYAEQLGDTTAQEACAIGLNWVLAPIVDVNNNPDNPVINVRSFGETPAIVSQLITAFLRGAQRHPVLTAAKHFPGHGDTAVDSHLALPVLPHALDRLAQIEIPPFKAAIAAGVDTVMSAHVKIPALDPEFPATLSSRILTQELRQALGFDGLIVTDALVMGAIADRYGANEAAVLAVEAGADILLMPLDPEGAIQAICEAIETGRIAVERIQSSVERIWRAKYKVCPSVEGGTSHAWETPHSVPIETQTLTTQLAQPQAQATVAAILQDSMQVHCPEHSRLTQPRWSQNPRNLIIVDELLACEGLGRHTPAIALPQSLGYQLQVVDRHTPAIALNAATITWQPTLLQLFIRGNPFRGSAGLTHTAIDWFHFLVETDQLLALVLYGSPYVLDKFLPSLPAGVPYVFTYGQMPSAQTIALEFLRTPQ
ncbi:glycoside hydrolase family 3 N-terminal domain-containing protein [Stenomitos frigidus]|uniref:beta-N-acetylhexosaminidase n=1 Tax=Stenomitos frigidus ULC18 TaxID=2107698 RepID=A0A2T1DVN9_9CYAN|nr:glycoside hydrolase family 3 N-terminal domain-containing protein [Stenomitos frigidus]PSB24557.1 beta-glucosidase [Stenomitos frigidus ULC18]